MVRPVQLLFLSGWFISKSSNVITRVWNSLLISQYSSFSCSATTNLMWAKNTAMKPIPDEYETFYRINTCGPSVISLAQLGAEVVPSCGAAGAPSCGAAGAPSLGAERCFSALNETVRRRGLVHLRRRNLVHPRRRDFVESRRLCKILGLAFEAIPAWKTWIWSVSRLEKLIYGAFEAWAWFVMTVRPMCSVYDLRPVPAGGFATSGHISPAGVGFPLTTGNMQPGCTVRNVKLLTPGQEKAFVDWIKHLSEIGHPLSKRTIAKKVQRLRPQCGLRPRGDSDSFIMPPVAIPREQPRSTSNLPPHDLAIRHDFIVTTSFLYRVRMFAGKQPVNLAPAPLALQLQYCSSASSATSLLPLGIRPIPPDRACKIVQDTLEPQQSTGAKSECFQIQKVKKLHYWYRDTTNPPAALHVVIGIAYYSQRPPDHRPAMP
ncbi:uncharacterized protein C8Q71DRAFT_890061 [Rhodofomes roseus]|uniref:Uncharacterized protein n=1 Tax=Rhodofomes roseus TaxID=34475 RepID=A0ABQ8KSL0_9APHY|nr:uncharacterized protein C8Q71DRAFT_890061 [Rhodofomes roseus]KAH9840924.1 hypothetical protein C8Q71DRAFT_890061 [Rhodofomes roseus]